MNEILEGMHAFIAANPLYPIQIWQMLAVNRLNEIPELPDNTVFLMYKFDDLATCRQVYRALADELNLFKTNEAGEIINGVEEIPLVNELHYIVLYATRN